MKRFGLYAIISLSAFLLCCMSVQGTDGSLLRIDGPCGWTKNLEATIGSTVYLVVLPGIEGVATLCGRYPDGSIRDFNYFLQGYDRLPIHLDTLGRHVFSYSIGGRESNSVTIDVIPAKVKVESPVPCVAQGPIIQNTVIVVPAKVQSVSLSRERYYSPVALQYYPIGAHIMNDQNGIVVPKYASQYYFGRDFSLGTIDNNYPGTPFILQYLSDP